VTPHRLHRARECRDERVRDAFRRRARDGRSTDAGTTRRDERVNKIPEYSIAWGSF
jgi:hypothetical protein